LKQFTKTVAEVYERISPHIIMTPLIRSAWYSRISGNEVYFKCENLQHTQAFKIRGALSKLLSMSPEELKGKTLVTASGGNHGLAVVYSARLLGLKSVIFLPESAPHAKVQAIEALGGVTKIAGTAWDEANEIAMEAGRNEDFLYIHPFDDGRIIEGQATIAHEICRQIEEPDWIMASIGGGGLISGLSQYIKSFDNRIRIAGVETRGADSMHQSVHAGRLITLEAITSKAESLGAKRVSSRTFDSVKKYTDALYVVDDAQAEEEQAVIQTHEHMDVELASSCVVSAFIQYLAPKIKNQKIVIVLCGAKNKIQESKTKNN
jgi:threonine dehydratase